MAKLLGDTIGLLIAALFVAILARQIRLPYTVGLVVAGMALALARVGPGILLTHDFIFDLLLPPLLFEAALSLHWRELRREAGLLLVLTVLGVLITAAVVSVGTMTVLRWPLAPAALFGVIVAATDPVAVIALFKDTGVKGRLRLLVESESLFNDGVAAVLFGLALSWVGAGPGNASLAEILRQAGGVAGGGVLIGVLAGALAVAVAGRTADHLVETALTVVAAYGAFLLAERLRFSGVLATVAAGLLMGNIGLLGETQNSRISVRGRAFVVGFWEFAAFVDNSLIFPLIGLALARADFSSLGPKFLLVILFVQVGRALTVYPLSALWHWTACAVSLADQHVLFWGGLRGALALALVLSLPQSVPLHDQIEFATFGVVAFSVLVQGLTMPALLRRLGHSGS